MIFFGRKKWRLYTRVNRVDVPWLKCSAFWPLSAFCRLAVSPVIRKLCLSSNYQKLWIRFLWPLPTFVHCTPVSRTIQVWPLKSPSRWVRSALKCWTEKRRPRQQKHLMLSMARYLLKRVLTVAVSGLLLPVWARKPVWLLVHLTGVQALVPVWSV